jgi:Chaperone of endosialidase
MTAQKLLINHLNPSSLLRQGWVLILFAVGSFAFSPQMRAACDSPDPGCPGSNLAEGFDSLLGLTSGFYNTGIGTFALLSLTDASFDTAVGAGALFSDNAGSNTAIGAGALFSNTTGDGNTASGAFALFSNTTGNQNTAYGHQALLSNNTDNNTAVGWNALAASTGTNSGGEGGNTAIGSQALVNNIAGVGNTAIGWLALLSQTDADNNTAVGAGALGQNTGGGNTALGTNAGGNLTTGFNNIDIGDSVTGPAAEDNTIRIGASQTATFIAGISGTAVVGDTVVVDANGQLGTATSSARFKKEIKPMDKASEAILALKPVSFQYKSDSKGTPQFGLIAEEVAKVNPDLIVRDRKGEIYSVRYDQVNAMLLNEFLKEHRKVEQLEKRVAALTAGLQKVSAQLELSKPAPQAVSSNQ